MKHICILTHAHLCRNPRVVKEAAILNEAGYKVTIMTVWSDEKLLSEDMSLIDKNTISYLPTINMIKDDVDFWERNKSRLIKKTAGMLVNYLGIETDYAIGYGYKLMLTKARHQNADLYICHQELPTAVGCKLITEGFSVAFDFEDWYSHDLLPEANRNRPVKLLKKYEKFALLNGKTSYTTSSTMAMELSKFAGSRIPHVILNSFPFTDRNKLDGQQKDRKRLDRISLFWFSQTIGPGRGLESLADALNDIHKPFELHLRGNIIPSYAVYLKRCFNLKKNQEVFFHPLVSHNELLSRIAEHDVGLALEQKSPQSRNLTITNKILQYLLGGLAIIATDTTGQKEVTDQAEKSIFLFRDNTTHDLKDQISRLINNNEMLQTAKKEAVRYAKQKFSTEIERDKLVNLISEAIVK